MSEREKSLHSIRMFSNFGPENRFENCSDVRRGALTTARATDRVFASVYLELDLY